MEQLNVRPRGSSPSSPASPSNSRPQRQTSTNSNTNHTYQNLPPSPIQPLKSATPLSHSSPSNASPDPSHRPLELNVTEHVELGPGQHFYRSLEDQGADEHSQASGGMMDEEHKLGQFTSTAICGNDILASVLYTVGLCVSAAGVYAPLSMMLIGGMLYLFRSVYGEVGTALPLNGGAYNCLLNTTSKKIASLAACLTILSYMATGVVSATEACDYLQTLWEGEPIATSTIVLFVCVLLRL